METKKVPSEVARDDAGERRSSRLVRPAPATDAFAGWGPRMAGSPRDVLRGLN